MIHSYSNQKLIRWSIITTNQIINKISDLDSACSKPRFPRHEWIMNRLFWNIFLSQDFFCERSKIIRCFSVATFVIMSAKRRQLRQTRRRLNPFRLNCGPEYSRPFSNHFSLADTVISALKSFETGQPVSAAFTAASNLA